MRNSARVVSSLPVSFSSSVCNVCVCARQARRWRVLDVRYQVVRILTVQEDFALPGTIFRTGLPGSCRAFSAHPWRPSFCPLLPAHVRACSGGYIQVTSSTIDRRASWGAEPATLATPQAAPYALRPLDRSRSRWLLPAPSSSRSPSNGP